MYFMDEEDIENSPFTTMTIKNITILVVVLVLLGVLGTWMLRSSNESAPSDTTIQDDTSMMDTTGAVSHDSYYVRDQEEGMKVVVRDLSLTGPTWLVVHEHTESGALGNALGAGLFSGSAAFGEVPLLRGTEAGHQYSVLIYEDDGDHEFDLKKDMQKLGPDGKPISVDFFALISGQ